MAVHVEQGPAVGAFLDDVARADERDVRAFASEPRALFAAGRVDEAMARANRVERRAVATAAIDALIAAGRPAEAESFLASAPYIDTERG